MLGDYHVRVFKSKVNALDFLDFPSPGQNVAYIDRNVEVLDYSVPETQGRIKVVDEAVVIEFICVMHSVVGCLNAVSD